MLKESMLTLNYWKRKKSIQVGSLGCKIYSVIRESEEICSIINNYLNIFQLLVIFSFASFTSLKVFYWKLFLS